MSSLNAPSVDPGEKTLISAAVRWAGAAIAQKSIAAVKEATRSMISLPVINRRRKRHAPSRSVSKPAAELLESTHAPGVARIAIGQPPQEARRRLRRAGAGVDGGGKGDVALQLRRQRPDQRDALDRQYLADVEETDLGIAAGDLRHAAGECVGQGHFWSDRIRDAQAREHARDLNARESAAARVGMRDRARREQGLAKGLRGRDVG